jgi:hypothetical protein
MAKDASQLQSNPLITKLRQASKTDSVAQFAGYLDTSEDGVVCLFDDLSFESYVELRSADVIEVMEVPSKGVNRHRVFVAGSAPIRRVTAVSSRAEALGGGGSISPGGGSSGGVVARWNDYRYYQSGEFLRNLEIVRAGCRDGYNERISAINDTIDVLEGINSDGRFDGLIENLREQIKDYETQRSRC